MHPKKRVTIFLLGLLTFGTILALIYLVIFGKTTSFAIPNKNLRTLIPMGGIAFALAIIYFIFKFLKGHHKRSRPKDEHKSRKLIKMDLGNWMQE